MVSTVLILIGAAMSVFWGAAHLFPTKSTVAGFGGISEDNRNIIRMEWINEGLTLIFIGTIVTLVTLLGGGITKIVVHGTTAVMLFAMATVSMLTGFRVKFIPFKLCPIIFTISALLILQNLIWD